jgi:DNA-binding response OmpR family regulator
MITEGKAILVIEDEKAIADIVTAYLEKDGFSVSWAKDGAEGLSKYRAQSPDLIVLDLMLPFISGEKVIAAIRETSSVPVIMLTAKTSEGDIVAGLDHGADDYIPKPFSPKELVARVKALLRRFDALKSSRVERMALGQLLIDLERKEVSRQGEIIKLTKYEYAVLETLALHKQRTFSREELITAAFGEDYQGFDRTIDSHVKNLRKKLAAGGDSSEYVETVHGIGYRIGGRFI